MSRIGRAPIAAPAGVKVQIAPDNTVTVTGPKGTLKRTFPATLKIEQGGDGALTVTRPDDSKTMRSLHGLSRTLLANMVTGVSEGYKKSLEIQGVGYKAEQKGKNIVLSVGYAHTVNVPIPGNVTVQVEGTNKIHVSGADKQAVGQFAAQVRKVRKPEPYKGKGIRYEGEQVKIKPGKAFAGAGAK